MIWRRVKEVHMITVLCPEFLMVYWTPDLEGCVQCILQAAHMEPESAPSRKEG
jgi:hypothetical protein